MLVLYLFGGGGRDRTDDIQLAKLALSQLSYTPKSGAGEEARTLDIFLGKEVLYQLSYTRFVSGSGPWNRTTLQGLTVPRLHRVCLTGIHWC